MGDGPILPDYPSKEVETDNYEPLLWKRAEELSNLRTGLQERLREAFEQANRMRNSQLNLHEQELLSGLEKEYWRIYAKINEIQIQEDQLAHILEQLEGGQIIDPRTIKKALPDTQRETSTLSKRKQRILEDQKKLGLDPRESDWDFYNEFGSLPPPPSPRLTTGNQARKISGNFDSLSAEDTFFQNTADTHGGKVSFGKARNSYVNSRGKRVRKF